VIGRKADRRYLPGRSFDVPVNLLSIERARRELGWEPKISFEDGIDRFAKWIEAFENSAGGPAQAKEFV